MTDNNAFNVFAVGLSNTACSNGERWGTPMFVLDGRLVNDLPLLVAGGYLTSPGDRLGLGSGQGMATYYRKDDVWEY